MISTKNLLYLLSTRKMLILFPLFLTPLFAILLLLFTEPTFISVAKIWAKEKADESMLLRIQRKGIQENTYAEVQAQIIKSNKVFQQVIEKLHLDRAIPSRTIFARLTGRGGEGKEPSDESLLEALHMLHKQVSVDVVNPEVLIITAKMNTPELSQKVLEAVIEFYKKVYLEILNKEVDDYEKLLAKQIASINRELREKSNRLLAFESHNPLHFAKRGIGHQLLTPVAVVDAISEKVGFSPSLAKTIADASPIPLIMNRIGELEMEQNQLKSIAGVNNFKLRQVEEEIGKNKLLLERYNRDLSNQALLTIHHDELIWELEETRKRYDYVVGEYDKILVSRGFKVKQTSSITILDSPTYEPKAIAPKKRMTVMASTFLGLVIAFALFYLSVVSDQKVYFSEELERISDLPLLGIFVVKD